MATALVVGSSAGIGLALARRLVARDWTVIGLARRPAELVDPRYRHVLADVSAADYRAVLTAALDGVVLDVCVYGAGIGHELDVTTFAGEAGVVTTNLVGAIVTAEVVLPPMIAARAGHFVGLSSQGDKMVGVGAPSYVASKAGLSAYLEGIAPAVRPHGVRVTNVRLGFVDTAMSSGPVRPFLMSAERAARHVERCLARRPVRYTAPWRMAALLWLVRGVRRLAFWRP